MCVNGLGKLAPEPARGERVFVGGSTPKNFDDFWVTADTAVKMLTSEQICVCKALF